MLALFRRSIGSWATPPPLPPEALPPGIFGRSGLARATMQIAWDAMGRQMFLNGLTVGALAVLIALAVAIAVGLVVRSTLRRLADAIAA